VKSVKILGIIFFFKWLSYYRTEGVLFNLVDFTHDFKTTFFEGNTKYSKDINYVLEIVLIYF